MSPPQPQGYGVTVIVPTIVVSIVQSLAFVSVIYGMFAGMARLSRWLMRGRYERATISNILRDASGASTIPVLATFTGVRGLPWWYGITTNNAKPLLVIERDGIRFRVVSAQYRRFADIACVDIRQATGTVNLTLTFHGTLLNFSANFGAVPLAAHVLHLLPVAVPLSARAMAVRDADI